MDVYHVDMSFGSIPRRVHSVACFSAACSRVKQLESLSQPCSRKWLICSWESGCCSSAIVVKTRRVVVPHTRGINLIRLAVTVTAAKYGVRKGRHGESPGDPERWVNG